MENYWIRKEYTDENDKIIDFIDDVDLYEIICNDDDEYYMIDPNAWERACKEYEEECNQQKEWEDKHNRTKKCIELSEKAREALLQNDTDTAILFLEKAISLRSLSSPPLMELKRIYKKRKDVENELRVSKLGCELFPNNLYLQKRVRELEGTLPSIKAPCKRHKIVLDEIPLGDKLYDVWNSLTNSDFIVDDTIIEYFFDDIIEYNEEDENGDRDDSSYEALPTLKLKEEKKSIIINYHNQVYEALNIAKKAIADNDYCTALDVYETILAKKVPCIDYYESLREIYQKFRLREAEMEMLKEVVKFVEEDEIRYQKLITKIKTWFPNTDFSIQYPLIEGLSIYHQKPSQLKRWKERICWLEERVFSKRKE